MLPRNQDNFSPNESFPFRAASAALFWQMHAFQQCFFKRAHKSSYLTLLTDPVWEINLLRNKMPIVRFFFHNTILSFSPSCFLLTVTRLSISLPSSLFLTQLLFRHPLPVSSWSSREFCLLLFYFFNPQIHISSCYDWFPIDNLFL